MSYIDKNLLPEERVLFRTKKHVFIFLFPAILLLFSLYAAFYMNENPILANLAWVPGVVTLICWAYTGLDYITSEFVVTNKRVLMREGFFYRHTTELRLTTISQVSVEQSLVGQMLNYGSVALSAFGVQDIYSLIAHPLTFKKYIYEQLDKLTK